MNESTSAKTRRLPSQCRAVGFLLSILIGFPVWSQASCEEVPEPRRALCEKVMDCMAIEAADARGACIEAAQKLSQQSTWLEQPPQSEEPIPPEPRQETGATLEQQTVVIQRETSAPSRDAPQAEHSRLREPAKSSQAQRVSRRARRSRSRRQRLVSYPVVPGGSPPPTDTASKRYASAAKEMTSRATTGADARECSTADLVRFTSTCSITPPLAVCRDCGCSCASS